MRAVLLLAVRYQRDDIPLSFSPSGNSRLAVAASFPSLLYLTKGRELCCSFACFSPRCCCCCFFTSSILVLLLLLSPLCCWSNFPFIHATKENLFSAADSLRSLPQERSRMTPNSEIAAAAAASQQTLLLLLHLPLPRLFSAAAAAARDVTQRNSPPLAATTAFSNLQRQGVTLNY